MKRVLVLGATGGTGSSIVQELLDRKVEVVVFGRSLEKLKQRWPAAADWRVGDIFDTQSIISAGNDCDLIFQCAAIPYHQTTTLQLPLGESVMNAALKLQSKVIFIDGIYAYGKSRNRLTRETDPLQPVSQKGRIKKQLSDLIFSQKYQGVPTALIRLPDYFGPTARASSYLGMTMQGIAQRKPTVFIGRQSVPREFIYLPDAAKMIVSLAENEQAFHQAWNIPGQIISGHELIKIARHASGSKMPVVSLTKPLLRVSGLFDADIREIVEMYYLTKNPVYLDGHKYLKNIGPIEATPFVTSITETINGIRHS